MLVLENSKKIFVENESLEGKRFERKKGRMLVLENSKEIFVENESLLEKQKNGERFERRRREFWSRELEGNIRGERINSLEK